MKNNGASGTDQVSSGMWVKSILDHTLQGVSGARQKVLQRTSMDEVIRTGLLRDRSQITYSCRRRSPPVSVPGSAEEARTLAVPQSLVSGAWNDQFWNQRINTHA
ncbi:hypothetical protein NDU88_000190 [Pleurodeles waltl]|uniref:Uncharacterized protein n=1 Tax=Pleurodeles waltl TaxID=8319 RepID=A0AAV7U6D9_PLEWA|nr:hypothetical protein NDU88_000190 [Pleurodeles waltl]